MIKNKDKLIQDLKNEIAELKQANSRGAGKKKGLLMQKKK